MKAILLLLAGLASLMEAELKPVSAIDFGPALHLKKNHRRGAIWNARGVPGKPAMMTTSMARSDRTGSAVAGFNVGARYGGGVSIAPLPDGSFWVATRWTDSDFPPPARTPGIIDTTAVPHGTTRSGPTNYDLYTRDGHYLKSFRVIANPRAGIRSFGLPLNLAASPDEIAIVYGDLARVGHLSGGDFVTDRDCHVDGLHLVFALDHHQFAAVNRMTANSQSSIRARLLPVRSRFRSSLPVCAIGCQLPLRTGVSGLWRPGRRKIHATWFSSRLMARPFRGTSSTSRLG